MFRSFLMPVMTAHFKYLNNGKSSFWKLRCPERREIILNEGKIWQTGRGCQSKQEIENVCPPPPSAGRSPGGLQQFPLSIIVCSIFSPIYFHIHIQWRPWSLLSQQSHSWGTHITKDIGNIVCVAFYCIYILIIFVVEITIITQG